MIDPLCEKSEAELKLAYQRPTQGWVCGWAEAGHPCHSGPGPQGECAARAECTPHRVGDRWQCSRAGSCGGACADGPRPDGTCSRGVPPCQPVRSLRAKRNLLALTAASFSFGIILLLIGSPVRREMLSPGNLTFQHGTVTNRCEACHEVAPETFGELFEQTQMPHKDVVQTRLCLECHEMGDQPTGVHGLSATSVDELTRKVRNQAAASSPLLLAIARKTWDAPRGDDGLLTCGTCHVEHKGPHAAMSFMNNQKCQACHLTQFASLADGHPEFRNYPYRRRTALYFDHESHLGRHFQEAAHLLPPEMVHNSCLMCHTLDRSGQMMVARSFEESCANCHLSQITDTTLAGVRFLNLPAIDLEPLAKLKAPVGAWPISAAGDPSPILELLLAEKGDQPSLDRVDLTDLRSASPGQLEAAGDLAWNIKGLIFDLLTEGNHALRTRLARLANSRLSAEQITLMMGDLAPSTVRTAQEKWLPGLLQEAPAHRAGQPLPAAAVPASVFVQPDSVRWRIDDAQISLQYLPRRHADLFMQTWLDVSGREYARSPAFARVFDSLADPYGAGRCTKCHSVESHSDGSRSVHWKSAEPPTNRHAFTSFVHAPHFSLLGGKRCDLCHTLAEGSDYAASFVRPDHTLNPDPAKFAGNFQSLEKSICTQCHTASQAGDSCLQCHNYHIGTFTANRMPAGQFVKPAVRPGKSAGH